MNSANKQQQLSDFEKRLVTLRPRESSTDHRVFYQAGYEAAKAKHSRELRRSQAMLLAASLGVLALGGRVVVDQLPTNQRQLAQQAASSNSNTIIMETDLPRERQRTDDSDQTDSDSSLTASRALDSHTTPEQIAGQRTWSPATALRNYMLVSSRVIHSGIEVRANDSSLDNLVAFPQPLPKNELKSVEAPRKRRIDYTQFYRNPTAFDQMLDELL